jgi:hypothetical protein
MLGAEKYRDLHTIHAPEDIDDEPAVTVVSRVVGDNPKPPAFEYVFV